MQTLAGYQAYQKNKYETASHTNSDLMLYDGAIRFSKKAIEELESKNIAESHQFIVKAQDVVYELISSLNEAEGGEMAQNLKQLYLYIIEQMVQANLKKDSALMQERSTFARVALGMGRNRKGCFHCKSRWQIGLKKKGALAAWLA